MIKSNHDENFYEELFTPIINQRTWLFLLVTLGMHLLIIGAYVKHHQHLVQINNTSRQAMERLIIRASEFTTTNELKTILKEIDDSGMDLGNYKLKFNVEPPHSIDNSSENDFYHVLPDGKWLHYTEKPIIGLFESPVMIVIFEAGMIGLVIFYFWTIFRFTKPLKKIKIAAERFGAKLYAEPLDESGHLVIRETSDAINKMQKRIQDLVSSRTKMLAAISHDLRTPITRLKLRAQFVKDSKQSEQIIADLDEMEFMITEILSFASNDLNQEKETKFDIRALLLTVCNYFVDRGHVVEMKEDLKCIPYFGRCIAIKRTFVNLIENAIKYAGHARIYLNEIDNHVIILIEDNGPGIPREELEKVLLPYYRASQTTDKNRGGTGLGLTIADEIIRNHGGTLRLNNLETGGLQAIIILPL